MPSRYDVRVSCGVCGESWGTVAESVGHQHFTDEYSTIEEKMKEAAKAAGYTWHLNPR